MSFFARHEDSLERIIRTGFLTSLVSYGAFLLLDALRPGFVSRYLSVHLFLAAAIAFGLAWMRLKPEGKAHRAFQWLLAIAFGLFAAVLTWRLGHGLGDERLVVVVVAALAPAAFLSLLASND